MTSSDLIGMNRKDADRVLRENGWEMSMIVSDDLDEMVYAYDRPSDRHRNRKFHFLLISVGMDGKVFAPEPKNLTLSE